MAMSGGGGTSPNINVTPLVDVVLVLLIIFMVVTPLLEKEMPVRVPDLEQQDVPPPDVPPDEIVVQIRNNGLIYVNQDVVMKEALLDRLTLANNARSDKTIFFDADDATAYGVAVEVLDIIKQAGTETVGMMMPDPTAPGAAPAPGTPTTPQK